MSRFALQKCSNLAEMLLANLLIARVSSSTDLNHKCSIGELNLFLFFFREGFKIIFEMEYTIDLIDKNIAKDLIIKNHYSHKWTSCRYAIGLFDPSIKSNDLFDKGKLIGVAVYGFPVGRQTVKSITPNLENNEVLELTRLWLEDDAPKNSESYFLGKTFDWLRKNTDIKVLISYSDPMQDHLGIIYQATNWLYQGNNTMLIKGYLHKINGEIMHPRSVVALYGTIKEEDIKKIDPNYERIEMKKKHRYLYILHKKDRKKLISELKHKIIPYPKDNLNCGWAKKRKEKR